MWLQSVTMIQNCMPKNTENWQLMFATCIAHQPELVETETMQSTLKEDVLCVCITEHSCSLQTPPLLGVFYPAKQKSSARQKGRKGPRTGTDALSTGSSYHVHGAMAIFLLLDTQRSNMEKVNT